MPQPISPDLLIDAFNAARLLLGYKLVHQTAQATTAGIIVETEASHFRI